MGFFDSKSSSSSASGTVGSQTQTGDPTSINIAAGDDLKGSVAINVQNTYVDPGAFALATEAVRASESVGNAALDVASDFGRQALALGELGIDRAFDLAEQVAFDSARYRDAAVQQATEFVEHAYRFADDAGARVQAVATDAIDATTTLAQDVAAQSFAALADTQGFAERVIGDHSDFALALVESQTERAFDAAGQFLTQGQALLARESSNQEGRLEAITDRALMVGGVVLVAALGAVAFAARR